MKITCENENGDNITFAYRFPYWLEEVEGIYGVGSEVTTINNALTDGEIYAGNNVQKRNIVITAKVYKNHEETRELLEKLFAPHIKGTFTYEAKDYKRTITYYAENFEMDFRGNIRDVTISLICPDPMFYGEPNYYYMLQTIGLIHFPINVSEPFQVTNTKLQEFINVQNSSPAEQGLIFRITALLDNIPLNFYPDIANLNTGEHIFLDTMKMEQGLSKGEYIEISTIFGNKYIDVIRGDMRYRINSMWQGGNTWIQAHKGDNVFRLSTAMTLSPNALNLTIIHTPSYWRV